MSDIPVNIIFVDKTKYEFDSNLIEIVGSSAKLKSQIPAGGIFHNSFNIDKNSDWSSGSILGTLVGDATVSGGALNLTTSNNNYISYPGSGNIPLGNEFCINFKIKTNYTGAPISTGGYFISVSNAENDIKNMIRIRQIGLNIRYDIYDSTGVSIITVQTGNVFNPTADTEYEIELNGKYDTGLGLWKSWLLINGTLTNGVQSGTSASRGGCTLFRIGKNYTSGIDGGTNAKIFDVVIYDTVQHTADYTPGQVIPTKYPTSNPTIQHIENFGTEKFTEFAIIGVEHGNDKVKIATINTSGEMYWDGTTWTASSGYAMSNVASDVDANASSFNPEGLLNFLVYLHSENGRTTLEIDNLYFIYCYDPPPIDVDTVTVTGYIYKADGSPDVGAKMLIRPEFKAYIEGQNTDIVIDTVTAVADSDGGWSIALVPTNSIGNIRYKFKEKSTEGNIKTRYRKVEGEAVVNFEDLEE